MPALSDLITLPKNKKNSKETAQTISDGPLFQFAALLRVEISKARDLFENNGAGRIYAPNGSVFFDTKYARHMASKLYTYAVIIEADGTILYLSRYKYRKERIRAQQIREEIEIKREKGLERRERARIRVKRSTEKMFRDCQTEPGCKRGGKGNSHEDIGKFVNKRRSFRVDEYITALENLAKRSEVIMTASC